MTAGTSIEAPVHHRPDGSIPDGAATGAGLLPTGARTARQIPWLRIGAMLGVLVPLGIMVRYASHAAPAFDGAMNLQVATNISNGLGFVRNYGGAVLFPSEIQTSGIYIFLAAGFIKVFGTHSFVYEIPNLIFLALLLVTVSLVLRRWPVMRIIGPSAVLFCAPGAVTNSLQGYGEYVVAALVIAAFALVGAAASGLCRPVLATGAAWILVGAALTVKIIALMAVPVLIVGIIGLALARPAVNRWKLTASVLLAAIPVGLVELQRLIAFGSIGKWVNFWSAQVTNAAAQAGVSSGQGAGTTVATGVSPSAIAQGSDQAILSKIADHVHLLAVLSGIQSAILIMVLGLPFVVLVGLFLVRHVSWREWLARPAVLLSVMLASYAGGYLIWWLAITPTSKAWLRRIVIALAVIVFLYLLLLAMAKDHWNSRAAQPVARSGRLNTTIGIGWGVVGVLAFLSILPGITTANQQLSGVVSTASNGGVGVAKIEQLAAAADQLRDKGDTLYGIGWWSAPVVALYADVPLGNLQSADRCSSDIIAGKAYVIWDFYAVNLASPQPYSSNYLFTQISDGASSYGAIWKVRLRPNVTCPTA